jgi:hypothetical protein
LDLQHIHLVRIGTSWFAETSNYLTKFPS